jgi:hypothetical protein
MFERQLERLAREILNPDLEANHPDRGPAEVDIEMVGNWGDG